MNGMFVCVLVAIREEIREIEEEKYSRENNVLKVHTQHHTAHSTT